LKSGTTGGNITVSVDAITMTVYYTLAPAVTIDAVTPNPTPNGTTVTWHSDTNGSYEVQVGGTDCSDGTVVGSGNYTTTPATIDTAIAGASLSEGSNTVRVCVTDIASNTGSATTTVTRNTPNLSSATASCVGDASTGGSQVWTNPNNAAASDNVYTTASIN